MLAGRGFMDGCQVKRPMAIGDEGRRGDERGGEGGPVVKKAWPGCAACGNLGRRWQWTVPGWPELAGESKENRKWP